MVKRKTVTVYMEDSLYQRIQKAQSLRAEISGPGWKSLSLFATHLLEEGLKNEEKALDEEKAMKGRTKRQNKA